MTYEENETIVVYDYENKEVELYTTRRGEKRNMIKRLGEDNVEVSETVSDGETIAWTITSHIDNCRNPYIITKVLN